MVCFRLIEFHIGERVCLVPFSRNFPALGLATPQWKNISPNLNIELHYEASLFSCFWAPFSRPSFSLPSPSMPQCGEVHKILSCGRSSGTHQRPVLFVLSHSFQFLLPPCPALITSCLNVVIVQHESQIWGILSWSGDYQLLPKSFYRPLVLWWLSTEPCRRYCDACCSARRLQLFRICRSESRVCGSVPTKVLGLKPEIVNIASNTYRSLVPFASYHGQIGGDYISGKEPLLVYVMGRVKGISHLDFILEHSLPENSPEFCTWRENLISDIARYVQAHHVLIIIWRWPKISQ